jgi:hypothetical protein
MRAWRQRSTSRPLPKWGEEHERSVHQRFDFGRARLRKMRGEQCRKRFRRGEKRKRNLVGIAYQHGQCHRFTKRATETEHHGAEDSTCGCRHHHF